MAVERLEVLVEERSMKVALGTLLGRIVPGIPVEIHAFQGKPDLLRKLDQYLAGYKWWLSNANAAVVVVVDRDNDDCVELKYELEAAAHKAGLCTPASAAGRRTQVLNRIAVQELEAWFFGDVPAISKAYPGVPGSLGEKKRYREPDRISDTWERLESVLQKAGHHQGGLRKLQAAEEISEYMDVEANRSVSFQNFRDGIRRLVKED